MIPFTRRRVVLIFVIAILLVTSGVACQWLLIRGRALTTLEEESAAGLFIEWRMPSWLENEPYFARLWPGTTIYQAQVNYEILDAAALGDALCHFGSLQRFNIGQGDAEPVHVLLSHCGEQPLLKTLLIFNVEIDDRILPVLAKWHAIEILAMVPNELTGEGFPLMPNLRSIDMAYSRINDKGFLQLTTCPKLEDLHCTSTGLTSAAIIQAIRFGQSHLQKLSMSDVYLKDGDTDKDRDKLRETVKQLAPKLYFGF